MMDQMRILLVIGVLVLTAMAGLVMASVKFVRVHRRARRLRSPLADGRGGLDLMSGWRGRPNSA
jgi:hypothetical protein